MRAETLSVYCLVLPSLNKADIYIHTYISNFSPCFLNFLINQENLIKIGRAGGNTLNRDWVGISGKTRRCRSVYWKFIFQCICRRAYIQGRRGGGWGRALLLHVSFCLQVTGVYYIINYKWGSF